MKKILIVLGLIVGFSTFILAETGLPTQPPVEGKGYGIKMKEVMEIRKQMREIETKAIEEDPELKKIQEEIKSLHQQLQEKVNAKLSNNQEYQQLKEKLESIKKEWKQKQGCEEKKK